MEITTNNFDIFSTPTVIDSNLTSKESEKLIKENVKELKKLQRVLYAQDKYSILCIFQATDTSGKDGAIRHVMSGINPQGTIVKSFKQPTEEELSHDWLWRCFKNLPERGQIGIFNRSYYEEVAVVKVHDLVTKQHIPKEFITDNIWNERYEDIKYFEDYFHRNGTIILKFFLHLSKDEQKRRIFSRIKDKSKNWKASPGDIKERMFWDNYQLAYQDMVNKTSTEEIPWNVIPADDKWLARKAISDIIINKIKLLKLSYPTVSEKELMEYKRLLNNE